VAETLNKFFASVTRAERTSQAKSTLDLTHITQNLTEATNLSLRRTNPIVVKEVTMKIKSNKATGCDLIPPRAVKESAEVLCHPFSTLLRIGVC
jgi:hypothetical protein